MFCFSVRSASRFVYEVVIVFLYFGHGEMLRDKQSMQDRSKQGTGVLWCGNIYGRAGTVRFPVYLEGIISMVTGRGAAGRYNAYVTRAEVAELRPMGLPEHLSVRSWREPLW